MTFIQISCAWRNRDDRTQRGIEYYNTALSKPYEDIVPPTHRAVYPLHCDSVQGSVELARERNLYRVRQLKFMDATGLRPSTGYRRALPKGADKWSPIPGTDHPRVWYDRACNAYVVTSEPYCGGDKPYPYSSEGATKLREWLQRFNWRHEVATWPGWHNPPMSRLEVLAPVSYPRWEELMHQINTIKELALAPGAGHNDPLTSQ